MTRNDALNNEAGFTIIEVLVAVFVLLLGVLGAVTMIDTASGITTNDKAREGAFNLSREVVEAARNVDYDTLTSAGAMSSLEAVNGLADASASTSGWQVVRRGITYTIGVTACVYDDPKDGGRSTADVASFCPGSAAPVAPPPANQNCLAKNPVLPCVDTQPDDFRKLEIKSQWRLNGATRNSTQTVLIVNPSGGRGPRIASVSSVPNLPTLVPANTIGPLTGLQPCTEPGHSGSNCIQFTVQTASAAGSVQWSSSDGVNKGQAAGAGNTWTFQYDLGTVGNANAVLDGNYTVQIQAYSPAGVAGDLAAQAFTVNRSNPSVPTQFAGGRNDRNGQIVDLSWVRNKETDIVGYRVYRVSGGGLPDVVVCGNGTPVDATSCIDSNPPSEPAAVTYYIVAVDKDLSGNLRESPASGSAQITTLATATNWPPQPWPGGNGGSTLAGCDPSTFTCLTPAVLGGFPVITWNNAATPPAGHTILFYRVYRDPGSTSNPSYSDRWDNNGSSSLSYKDSNFGASTSHTYVITAVDDSYSESPPLGPGATP